MAEPLIDHRGRCVVLPVDHVDTDQIIPSREMRKVGKEGLSDGLFAGWRYKDPEARTPKPDFALNRPEADGASILVSGENFGCGSSREHAVWALRDYGFRVVLAESFGSIFKGNCVRNGVLPIELSEGFLRSLKSGDEVAVSLDRQAVSAKGRSDRFEIDAYSKELLLKGQDPINLTLGQSGEIEAFYKVDRKRRPWLYSAT